MKRSILSVLCVALLLTILCACGNGGATEPISTEPPAKGGTLYIKVNPEIAVSYDADGKVVAVSAVTDDAKEIVDSYQDFVGKECTQVVTELVTKIGEAGYLSADDENVVVTISVEEGAEAPSEAFAEEVSQQVQNVITENHWQGTVMVETGDTEPTVEENVAPTEEPTVAPATDPTLPGSVPENAQKQENGTYVLTEQVNLNDQAVESDPYYIRTTIFNVDGQPVSQDRVTVETGVLNRQIAWEYDEAGLCIARNEIHYFSTGDIKRQYREEYDSVGRIIYAIEYDKDGTASETVSYAYYDNGNMKTEEKIMANGICVSRKEYYESGEMSSNSTFFEDGTPQSQCH